MRARAQLATNIRFKLIDLLRDFDDAGARGKIPIQPTKLESGGDIKKPLAIVMWTPEIEMYLQAKEQEEANKDESPG